MQRYIDADKLFKEYERVAWYNNADRDEIAEELLLQMPTADVVEVKHGEWISYPSDAYMKCSVCGMEYPKDKMPNIVGYCPNPNCGAKMDGGVKHE